MAQNEHEKTGYWLEGTADSLDDGAEWSGHRLATDGKAVVNGARFLMFIATGPSPALVSRFGHSNECSRRLWSMKT